MHRDQVEPASDTCWDPERYLQFAGLRRRPSEELLDRLPALSPTSIVDLGCGTGLATQLLAEKWPDADLVGVDSSRQMLEEAARTGLPARWICADVAHWQPAWRPGLIFAAAVMHFVGEHRLLLPHLLRQLGPGGCLALHMPDWRDAPWYQIALDVLETGGPAGRPLGPDPLRTAMAERNVQPVDHYYRLLAPLATEIDIWESSHLQVVHGDNPVFDWVSVSALRPVLNGLSPSCRQRFLEQYIRHIREQYPPERNGATLFPFRRIFLVARVPGGAAALH
ncbi:trans-aconitate methyltransferase [Jeongeupia sp. USM3]|nr:trans-aconitate methyltransferase [Jeongeupia sp. USM3]